MLHGSCWRRWARQAEAKQKLEGQKESVCVTGSPAALGGEQFVSIVHGVSVRLFSILAQKESESDLKFQVFN